jgi:hypothetical protein
VQSSRSVVHGPITWGEFVNQFERRFYPIAFTDKMKTQLERCHQGKKIVAEYEVEFNQIVRFVPHVAHNEYEKARIFHQGLKAYIRQVLGAFVLEDFRYVVERALGVEVQDDFTDELRGDHSQDQKGHTRGPTHKKDKNHHYHPYGGSSSQSRNAEASSGGGSTQFRAVAKPGLGLVCFRCGDAHRRSDCHWSGQCSRCGKDHKDVVSRKNPNSKLI